MNVFMLMIPKVDCCVLHDTDTLREGMDKMRRHGYTALPVITKDGRYAGIVSEGDFLWHLLRSADNPAAQDSMLIRSILQPAPHTAVRSSVTMDELTDRAMNQDFIPVVDDRSCLCGIVTRRRIMRAMLAEQKFTPPQISIPAPQYIY